MRSMLRFRRLFNGKHANRLLADIHPAFHGYAAALKALQGVDIRNAPFVLIVCQKPLPIIGHFACKDHSRFSISTTIWVV
jgi:hypothetical protein